MDTVQNEVIPSRPTPIQPQTPEPSLGDKLRNLTRKQKLLLGGVVAVLVIAIILGVVMMQKSQSTSSPVIAKIGDKNVYRSYLNQELSLFPAPKNDETTQILTQKIIDDQIILSAGKAEGVISDYPDGENLSKEQYLERTQKVTDIKKNVIDKQNSLEGELVSVWFYNAGFIGPEGYEKSKQLVFDVISKLYTRVQKKEISIKQAGELIAADKSLEKTDPAYKENAYTAFDIEQGKPITFWREFDESLRTLKSGEMTSIYLGDSFSENGGPTRDGVYVFGQVNANVTTSGYNSFDDWFAAKKSEFQPQVFVPFPNPVSVVLADDNGNNNGGGDENLYEGKCGHGCPPFAGTVLTTTGAPIPNALVTITNKRNETQQTTTNNKGEYYFEAVGNFNCASTPMRFTVNIPGSVVTKGYSPFRLAGIVFAQDESSSSASPSPAASPGGVTCDEVIKPIGNVLNVQTVSPIKCEGELPSPVPTPTPTPTPPPACNESCTTTSQCELAPTGGCTACLPNDAGTGTVCRPPVACNTACQRDDQCAGAVKDGCTACVAGSCQKPPACNVSCTSDTYCGDAKDGCTECAPNTAGKNVCQKPFNTAMCKCDGFNAINIQNPSAGDFKFEAFGLVKGEDVSRAKIDKMVFTLHKSPKNNPNTSTIVSTSEPITPTIVSTDNGIVRYRAEWSVKPPAFDSNAIYRVGAKPTCVKKTGPLSAAFDFSGNMTLYSSDNSQILGESNYTPATLAQGNDNLELGTLKDGYYTRIVESDSCQFIKFEYGQY